MFGCCGKSKSHKPTATEPEALKKHVVTEPRDIPGAGDFQVPDYSNSNIDNEKSFDALFQGMRPLERATCAATGAHCWSGQLGTAEEVKSRVKDGQRFPNPAFVNMNKLFEKLSHPSIETVEELRSHHSIVYSGQYWEGMKHGFGVQEWPDGATYTGQWRNNKAWGLGKFEHPGLDFYIGHWQDNAAWGFGLYVKNGERWYEGFWENDHKEGECFEGRDAGNGTTLIYQGFYSKSVKVWWGIHSWPDGSYYAGDFCNNLINGYGKYSWKDGREYIGQWYACKMCGWGKFTWCDGRTYIGQYADDTKSGFGIFIWNYPDKCHVGSWYKGKQHGYGIVLSIRRPQVKLGRWDRGELVETYPDYTYFDPAKLEIDEKLPKEIQERIIDIFSTPLEDLRDVVRNVMDEFLESGNINSVNKTQAIREETAVPPGLDDKPTLSTASFTDIVETGARVIGRSPELAS